jgi:hypothetical protein
MLHPSLDAHGSRCEVIRAGGGSVRSSSAASDLIIVGQLQHLTPKGHRSLAFQVSGVVAEGCSNQSRASPVKIRKNATT